MTPLEALEQAERIAAYYAPQAEQRKKAGTSADGRSGGRGKKNPVANKDRVLRGPKTEDRAAAGTGYSASTLRMVKEISEAAKADDPMRSWEYSG